MQHNFSPKRVGQWSGLVLLILFATNPVFAQTLQQAWDIALKVDHGIKAAEAETAAAAQQLQAARSARLPVVSVTAGYTVLDNEPASRANLGPTPSEFPIGEKDSLSYQASAILPLYTSGRISRGIDAADASLLASRTQSAVQTLDLKLQVAEAYVGVLRAAEGLRVASSHVDSLKAHARDVANMYEQGMVSRNDLLSAQVALADASQAAIKAQNALDIARAAFNRLLGRPLHQTVALDELEPVAPGETLDVLSERALDQRHELHALQAQISALHHQAAAVRAGAGPQLALSGGYGYQQNRYTVHEGQWSVNLGLQWQVFDGGLIRHQAAASERQAAALQEQHDDLASRITLQVRQYWLDVQETRKRIEVTAKAIAQAEENLKVNRDRYENGLSTNTEVLDAETLRTRSQGNHASAIYDAVLATLRLQRAAGEL